MHMEGLDQIDNKILEVIKENARLSYSEIGEQVGISKSKLHRKCTRIWEKSYQKRNISARSIV